MHRYVIAGIFTALLFHGSDASAQSLQPKQCGSSADIQAVLKAEGQVGIVIGNRVTTRKDRPVNIFTANRNGVGYELEGDAPQGTPSKTVCVVARYHDARINNVTSPIVPSWALIGNDRAAAEADCKARKEGFCESYDDYVRRATAGGMRVMLVARTDFTHPDGSRRDGRLLTILTLPDKKLADVKATNSVGASDSTAGLENVNYTQFAGSFFEKP